MKTKVYLDDERKTPEGWYRTYNSLETIEALKTGEVVYLSLDHDLGFNVDDNGYKVLEWLEEQVICHGFVPPRIMIHTANPSARYKMAAAARKIQQWYNENGK